MLETLQILSNQARQVCAAGEFAQLTGSLVNPIRQLGWHSDRDVDARAVKERVSFHWGDPF
jgi:hypothetical protein